MSYKLELHTIAPDVYKAMRDADLTPGNLLAKLLDIDTVSQGQLLEVVQMHQDAHNDEHLPEAGSHE